MNNGWFERIIAFLAVCVCIVCVCGVAWSFQVTPAHAATKYTCLHRPLYDRDDVRWVGYRGADGTWHVEHPTNIDPYLTIKGVNHE